MIWDRMPKKEEHLYPVLSPAHFNPAVTPATPVENCSNSFSKPHYAKSFLLVTIASQSSATQQITSNHLRLLLLTSL